MKNLDEIFVTKEELRLIIGVEINFPFPTRGKKAKGIEPVSLAAVLNHNYRDRYNNDIGQTVANVSSFDARFDKKHSLKLALDYIETNGIRKDVLVKIYANKKCVDHGRLVGVYSVFNDLLSEDQRIKVEDRLIWEAEQQKIRREQAKQWLK